ncbi:D-xylose reductase [Macrolepiota fuliginosa MF-IS2]|uniref:D-xylose reductase n=1 Tax=Macrolepiota fuliginosa MF-IS2 TaxID=1400762 RepID=A0A9P6C5Y1_9AGAR|nr:D-xylose reductase [Macrolepiota fuliginosa MF-IS2]
MAAIPSITLKSGFKMPQVGFGLWKVTENCPDTVYNAIKAGYRLFDGAFDYGNEEAAGKGVKRAIDEGLVKREDLFITSKLWNSFHEKDKIEPIVRQQLKWWGLDYFDLFLIHFPVALKYVDYNKHYPTGWTYKGEDGVDQGVVPINVPIQETWQGLESLVEKKLVRSIGVSNFQGALLMDVLRYAKVPVSALQIEHHPYLVQPNLVSLAKQEGIAVTAYSSFGPQSFVELDWEKAKSLKPLFEHSLIVELAKKYGKTPAQVLLRWATQRGLAVIPKSNSPSRLAQNLDCFSFNLEKSEIKAISALDAGIRFNEPVDYLGTLHIFA